MDLKSLEDGLKAKTISEQPQKILEASKPTREDLINFIKGLSILELLGVRYFNL